MRKVFYTLATFALAILTIQAQVPQTFKYQAVATYSNGQPISNQEVGFEIELLQGVIDGSAVYTETHTVTTNENGLVNIAIGGGTTTDSFSAINWANSPYFISISMDTTGGSNYVFMGASELMSVPYAKYAESAGQAPLPKLTQSEIYSLIPTTGMLVFNTDYNVLQFYDGTQWNGSQSSGCIPPPNVSNAGEDKVVINSLTTQLEGNVPSYNVTGEWSLISGSAGVFSDIADGNSSFTVIDSTEAYILRWTLTNECDFSSDDVQIMFSAPLVLSAPRNFYWDRYKEEDASGLDNFGLKWIENAEDGSFQIVKDTADKFVELSSSDWSSIGSYNELITSVNAATDLSTYNKISVKDSLDYVLGVKYGSQYFLLKLDSCTSELVGYSDTDNGTLITINGQYRTAEKYLTYEEGEY